MKFPTISHSMFFVFFYLIFGVSVFYAQSFYGPSSGSSLFKQNRSLSEKQRRLFTNSFMFSAHQSIPLGNNADLFDNGLQFDFAFKHRYYRSLTWYSSISYASYSALNQISAFELFDYSDVLNTLDVKRFNLYTGIKVYFPMRHRLSFTILGTLGTSWFNYFPTFVAGEVVTEKEVRDQIETDILKNASGDQVYQSPGFSPGVQLGIGMEYLAFYRISFELSFIFQSEYKDASLYSLFQAGVTLNYYFREFNFLIPNDLFD